MGDAPYPPPCLQSEACVATIVLGAAVDDIAESGDDCLREGACPPFCLVERNRS